MKIQFKKDVVMQHVEYDKYGTPLTTTDKEFKADTVIEVESINDFGHTVDIQLKDGSVLYRVSKELFVFLPKKITISEGCTAFYTVVDGKMLYGEYDPMTDQERDELIDYLAEKIKEEAKRSTISINNMIELFQYDRYETEEHCCDTCGDTVSRTYYEI